MDVSSRSVRILLEATDAASVTRDIFAGLELEEALAAPGGRVRWDLFVAIMDRVSAHVGHDPERIRKLGENMVRVPSSETLQALARSLVSFRTFLEAGNRWIARSFIPHIPLSFDFPAEGRVVCRATIPEPYAGSAPFFWLFEGSVCQMPRQFGLPPAVVDRSTVTPRTWDAQFAYPNSHSLLARGLRAARAAFSAPRTLEVLERQRGEFETGLEAMRRGSEELVGVLDGLPDLLVLHRGGSILWANRALLETFGFDDADEIVGKPLLSLFDEDSVPVARSRLLGPVSDDAAPAVEVSARSRNGAALTLELTRPQVVVFGGAPAGLAVARDVGERVHMQRQLIVSDRLASLGVLVAGVAHEINNPLACAVSGLEVAAAELDGLGLPRLREALDLVGEGMGRVRTIVRDLRTIGQSDDTQIVAVDVNAALESTLTLVAKPLALRARVERDYRGVPHARANPARLGQVFLNLLLNAIDAIRDGAPGENVVRVATGHDADGRVRVEISDSGPGIPAELLGRIFDPFFTTKPVGQGTGLGLTICHRIVTNLGGTISVDSALGVGTTLRLVLPAAVAAASSSHTATDAASCSHTATDREEKGRKMRVLLVDDEQRLLQVLHMVLEKHHVTTASSVDEALAQIADHPFDVVVSDVMMPGRNGLEFFAALEQSRPELCDRFVFMTGGALGVEMTLDVARTQRPCLEKPFQGEDLEGTVEAVLRDAAADRVPPHSIVPPAQEEDTTTEDARTREHDGPYTPTPRAATVW